MSAFTMKNQRFMAVSETVTPLVLAVRNGELDTLKELLQSLDEDVNTVTCTHIFPRGGRGRGNRLLVETTTALFEAVRFERLEMIPILVSYGANVNWIDLNKESALMIAVRKGRADLCRCLLEAGALFMCDTPLTEAARTGHEDLCRMLIKAGQDVNSLDRDGKPALWFAAEKGMWELARELLKAGARTQGCPALSALPSSTKEKFQQLHDELAE
jgi:ankyrin repeat protein